MSAAQLWSAPPDSSLSAEAEAEATALQSTAMLNHGYRTWIYGAAFAQIDGASVEQGLLYASALVHDIGLEHRPEGRCFTHRSAQAARDAGERARTEGDRVLAMMDGIAMHITPGLTPEESGIGYYIQTGAMADLAGIRLWELPKDLRTRAVNTYPRNQVHRVVSECWHAEAAAVPGGRAHFADTYGAFSRIVRWLPVP